MALAQREEANRSGKMVVSGLINACPSFIQESRND